jgi:hypothetical protein
MDSIRYTTQILRLPPQNDITTQSLAGEGKDEGTLIGTLTSILILPWLHIVIEEDIFM